MVRDQMATSSFKEKRFDTNQLASGCCRSRDGSRTLGNQLLSKSVHFAGGNKAAGSQ